MIYDGLGDIATIINTSIPIGSTICIILRAEILSVINVITVVFIKKILDPSKFALTALRTIFVRIAHTFYSHRAKICMCLYVSVCVCMSNLL